MKVIFLDIDGVVCLPTRDHDEYGSLFHQPFVDNLRWIVEETGAKIVISSTWRLSGLKVMKEMWEKRGLPGEVIDVTPRITLAQVRYNSDRTPLTGGDLTYTVPRGGEIEWWLDMHGKFQRINWSQEEQKKYQERSIVKNYVILDDDSDMLLGQSEHFVKTAMRYEADAIHNTGLTRKAAEEAIQILKKDLIELYYG
jgi:hypothetical protein